MIKAWKTDMHCIYCTHQVINLLDLEMNDFTYRLMIII